MANEQSNDVRLLVNGKEYGGWKSVRISAGIERQARDFDLSVTDVWPGATEAMRIVKGDRVQVMIGSDLVLTGYVDGTPVSYSSTRISVGVKGRSKTMDLVDCSPAEYSEMPAPGGWGEHGSAEIRGALVKPPARSGTQFKNQKIETIAAALAAPYGVRVLCETETGAPIPDHQVQQGESVFDSIDRMMRQRQVLSTDNALGDLVLIDVGSGGRASTALVLGENILSGSAPLDYKNVYTEYVCKGQRSTDDDEDSTAATESVAQARSTLLPRRRLLVIKQEGEATSGSCADRVAYEAAYRAGKAQETTYTVNGWRQADGRLWVTNQLVSVTDPIIGFDNADLLIVEVAYLLDDGGELCELTVGPPSGYVTKPVKSKKAKGGGGSWVNEVVS